MSAAPQALRDAPISPYAQRLTLIALAVVTATAQTPQPSDAAKLDEETLRHFQALVRMDTCRSARATSSRRPSI